MNKNKGDLYYGTKSNDRHQFFKYYADLCQFHNLNPSPAIKQLFKHSSLSLCSDRARFEDWQLISKAIRSDLSLESIYIWSRYCRINRVFLNQGFKRKAVTVKNIPPFLSPKTLSSLIASISKCLQNSRVLSSLRLHFLPLLSHDSKLLSERISFCISLQHLSLSHCRIGDEACVTLCKSLKTCANLKTLNLSGCLLSSVGVIAIATLIKQHSLTTFNEVWSRTLRQSSEEIPENDEGLKRITLNQNPLVGDLGIDHLAMTLLDDLCLRAIDLQDCGVTNIGGEILKCLLQVNRTLRIVDVRYNDNVDLSIFDDLLKLLMNNCSDFSQWQWMKKDSFITSKDNELNKWSEYDDQLPFHKLSLMQLRSESREVARDNTSYPSLRNKTFGVTSKFEVAQSRQKRSEISLEVLEHSEGEFILVEKSMLLEISATLQKITRFIRQLNLPQLISILKELKVHTEKYETCGSPDAEIVKEEIKSTDRDSDWSDVSCMTKNLNRISKRPLRKTTCFDLPSKISSCRDRTSKDHHSQSHQRMKACKPTVSSNTTENHQTLLGTTENLSDLFKILEKYSSSNSQSLPVTN